MKTYNFLLALLSFSGIFAQSEDFEIFDHNKRSTPVYSCGTDTDLYFLHNRMFDAIMLSNDTFANQGFYGTIQSDYRTYSKSKCDFSIPNFLDYDILFPNTYSVFQNNSGIVKHVQVEFIDNNDVFANRLVAFNDSTFYLFNKRRHELQKYVTTTSGYQLLRTDVFPLGNFLKKSNTEIYYLTKDSLFMYNGEKFVSLIPTSIEDADIDRDWIYNEENNLFYAFSNNGLVHHLTLDSQAINVSQPITISAKINDLILKNDTYYYLPVDNPYEILKYDATSNTTSSHFSSTDSIKFTKMSSQSEHIIVSGITDGERNKGIAIAQKLVTPESYAPKRVDLTFDLGSVEFETIDLSSPYGTYLFKINFSLTNNGSDTIHHFDLWSNITTNFGLSLPSFDGIKSLQSQILPGEKKEFKEIVILTTYQYNNKYTFGVPGANYKYDGNQSDNYERVDLLLSNKDFTSNKKLVFYPNPTSGFLYIKDYDHEEINIYDVHGHLLLSKNDQSSKIDISHLPQGVYIARIGHIGSAKIFKI